MDAICAACGAEFGMHDGTKCPDGGTTFRAATARAAEIPFELQERHDRDALSARWFTLLGSVEYNAQNAKPKTKAAKALECGSGAIQ